MEEGEDQSGVGGHHDGVAALIGAFLPESCLNHIVFYSCVVVVKGSKDDAVAGDALRIGLVRCSQDNLA